jgi:hypothetical protein
VDDVLDGCLGSLELLDLLPVVDTTLFSMLDNPPITANPTLSGHEVASLPVGLASTLTTGMTFPS